MRTKITRCLIRAEGRRKEPAGVGCSLDHLEGAKPAATCPQSRHRAALLSAENKPGADEGPEPDFFSLTHGRCDQTLLTCLSGEGER